MSSAVTQRDMKQLAGVGFPTQVAASERVEPGELAHALVHVLENPSARLLVGAAMAVRWLAENGELQLVDDRNLSEDAKRRFGFLLEKFASGEQASTEAAKLANRLVESVPADPSPLTFSKATTQTYLRQLRERADSTEDKWGVFADLSDATEKMRER